MQLRLLLCQRLFFSSSTIWVCSDPLFGQDKNMPHSWFADPWYLILWEWLSDPPEKESSTHVKSLLFSSCKSMQENEKKFLSSSCPNLSLKRARTWVSRGREIDTWLWGPQVLDPRKWFWPHNPSEILFLCYVDISEPMEKHPDQWPKGSQLQPGLAPKMQTSQLAGQTRK